MPAKLERIFGRIRISPQGCWEYTGGINASGYGIVSLRSRSVTTHRVAYTLRVGEIPAGMCVLHRCDNRRCINPGHLFLGTLGDNNGDRCAKGRNDDRRGERNTQAKVTPELIAEIKQLVASGMVQRSVARRFGISQQQVSSIVRGLAWPHLIAEVLR